MAAADVIDAYLSALPDGCRRLAHAEWGVTVAAEALGDEPLEIGISIADELVRAKAPALGAAAAAELDPWMLLWWNRQTRLVRFGSTRSHEIWVHADVPVSAVNERTVDRLLGLVVEAAAAVRSHAAGGRPD